MTPAPQAPGDGGHEAEPVSGTVYTVGPKRNSGQPANLLNPDHYPATALCRCGEIIRIDRLEQRGWVHTGRLPGDSL